MKSLFDINGYLAVIPQIQNVYPPEIDNIGWKFGFKYISGVFEFFAYETQSEAKIVYDELAWAIEGYYKEKEVINNGN